MRTTSLAASRLKYARIWLLSGWIAAAASGAMPLAAVADEADQSQPGRARVTDQEESASDTAEELPGRVRISEEIGRAYLIGEAPKVPQNDAASPVEAPRGRASISGTSSALRPPQQAKRRVQTRVQAVAQAPAKKPAAYVGSVVVAGGARAAAQGDRLRQVSDSRFIAFENETDANASGAAASRTVDPIDPDDRPARAYEDAEKKPITAVGLTTSVHRRLNLTNNDKLPNLLANETHQDPQPVSTYWTDYPIAPRLLFAFHPLYFEDPNLEHCGYDHGCIAQPIISGVYFFGNVALLPYKMLATCPCDYVCPLPDCQPCESYSFCDNYIGPRPQWRRLLRSPCYCESAESW